MKFGKRLLDQCVPDWTPFYLNYKLLKKHIMRVVAAQKVALRGADAVPVAADDDYTDAPFGSVADERAAFRQLLMNELGRINQFYLQKEAEFAAVFHHQYEPRVKEHLARPETITPDMDEFVDFFEFCRQLDALRNFTVLNYIGTLKICKKYDKKTEANEKPALTLVLMKQPFYTSTRLATLFTEVQCLFAQIVYHAKKVAPSPDDFTCPVCSQILHDPIVLSCTHRFCRSCLAKLCSTADGFAQHSCPVCQKEFDTLDPANYHVDSILAKFLLAHFAAAAATGTPMAGTSAPGVIDRMIAMSNPASRRASPQLGPMKDMVAVPMDALALGERAMSLADVRRAQFANDVRRMPSGADLRRMPTPLLETRREPATGFFLPYEKQRAQLGLLPFTLQQRLLLDSNSVGVLHRMGVLAVFALLVTSVVLAITYGASGLSSARRTSAEGARKAIQADVHNLAPPLPVFPDTVFVGHKVNDVDSICSAIAAAHLFDGYAARADAVSKEARFVLERFGLTEPPLSSEAVFHGKNWCLLDHNQLDKVPAGVNLERLVCVIDHHQLQGNAIEFAEPNVVEIQPWGSTTTILAYKYFQARRDIPRAIAGCLLAGIISDTVNLQSSTTTAMDRSAADVLAAISGVDDVDLFCQDMFAAKSDVSGLNLDEIMLTDYKEYTIGDRRVFFGVAETIHPKELLARRDDMLQQLPAIKARRRVDLAFFAVVDVRALRSVVMGAGPEEDEMLRAMYYEPTVLPRVFDSGTRVSRKKDFMPALIRHLRAQQPDALR